MFARHRDHYTALAARPTTGPSVDYSQLPRPGRNRDRQLHAAFVWNRWPDTEASALASSLAAQAMTRGASRRGAPGLTAFCRRECASFSRWRTRARLADASCSTSSPDAAAGMEQAQ